LVTAEVFEVVVGAAGSVTGQAPEAAVDRLALEAVSVGLDFGDNITARELCSPSALVEAFDGVENCPSATRAAVGDLGLQWWNGDGGPADGVVAVRIV
jgi:hypothetical protein